MPEYVTPERFKTMGFGVDLDDVQDFELHAVLRRASNRVNAICAAPGLPQPHDFRGGTISGEEHFWRMGDGVSLPAQRQIWLWHYPIKEVTQLRIRLTNSQYIQFPDTELVVGDRFVEIASLQMTSAGLFGAAIVPQIGLAKPLINVNYTYGWAIPITGETLEATDGLLYRAQDQWWTADDVTVYVDGSAITTGFAIQRDEGAILFESPQTPDAVITADFVTRLPPAIATATGILAAEGLGDMEMRGRGMGNLRSIRVGEIMLEKEEAMRGGKTVISQAQAEAEAHLNPFRFIWAGA